MSKFIDRTGHRYGKLRVLSFSHQNRGRVSHWLCECVCGEQIIVAGNNLQSGNSTTCGCVHGIWIDDPITHEQLLSLVRYEPHTGIFYRLVDGRSYKAGDRADLPSAVLGYCKIIFKKKQYYAHVVAWFYMMGRWPDPEVDHEDCDGLNNRWENLREATRSQNNANKAPYGEVGFKGVRPMRKKFVAKITVKKKTVYLGHFDTAYEAALAYDVAARKAYGTFARLNFEDRSVRLVARKTRKD